MSKRIIVLGAGMVGRAIARDLASQATVISVDRDPNALEELKKQGLETRLADLSNTQEVARVVESADLVVGAVPGFMGFQTLKTVIEAGKPVVDISFFPEDAFELDALARSRGVIAIVDAGVAPGMSNLILGYHNREMQIQSASCFVGGLPVQRTWPFAYKAPFSPIDVVEEYTRPARLKINGKIVVKPALSEPEFLEFDEIGTLEAFNTDGLRSLLTTLEIPNMSEKTLRYPGHREYMQLFSSAGFFGTEPVDIDGQGVIPIELTSRLLLKEWKLAPNENEFTVMRIILEGAQNSIPVRIQYDLLDRYDSATQTSSMARTTGYACTAMVNLVLQGLYTETGIHPPEHVGAQDGCCEAVLEYLQQRNIQYRKSPAEGQHA